MNELIDWLRVQLDEDERLARAAEGACWHIDYCDEIGPAFHARWDPARVLAEVEAKRRILDRYEDCVARQSDPDYSTVQAIGQAAEYEDWVIPAIAQPYAGREGWREEWRA